MSQNTDEPAERFYLCETFKSGRLIILGGGAYYWSLTAALDAASKPRDSFDGSYKLLPGVCVTLRGDLETGEDLAPSDDSGVRVVLRTEGYHG